MSVRIRLRRMGKRNAPTHRVVVADQRTPRDGNFIEIIGAYDPRNKRESIDLERVDYWVGNGAQMSETVARIVNRAREGISMYDRKLERDAEEARKRAEGQAKREAEAKAKAEEEAKAAAEKAEAAEEETAEAATGAEEPPAETEAQENTDTPDEPGDDGEPEETEKQE